MTTTVCPLCGDRNDRHGSTGTADAAPEAGDYSICWTCHAVGVFAPGPLGNLVVRPCTNAETQQFLDSPLLGAIGVGLRAPDAVTAGEWARRARRAQSN